MLREMRLAHHTTLLTLALLAIGAAPLRADDPPDERQLGHGYSRVGDTIRYRGKRIDKEGRHDIARLAAFLREALTLAHDVDAASFVALNERYSKDKQKVYKKIISPGRFWVVVLPGADPASFEALSGELARDKQRVWWHGNRVAADARTVKKLGGPYLWRDATRVWYQQRQIEGADAASFRHLASAYAVDARRAYWSGEPIEGAQVAAFAVLGESFIAVDGRRVYRSGKPLPAIDPASCRLILHAPYGYQVLADKRGVYLNGLRFLHAEPGSFKMLDQVTGRCQGEGAKPYAFLVDTYHCTPVTVHRVKSGLLAETILYERGSGRPLAIVSAPLTDGKLGKLTIAPPPGAKRAEPVPDWQLRIFQRPQLGASLQRLAELLEVR